MKKTLKREGVCAASLPTTMGVIAGLLIQNTLKYLLKFGRISNYIGYNALEDHFPTLTLKPNDECDDSFCRKRQLEHQMKQVDTESAQCQQAGPAEVLHENNDWGIELVSDSGGQSTVDDDNNNNLTKFASSVTGTIDQVKYQYTKSKQQHQQEQQKAKHGPGFEYSDNETSEASLTRDDDISLDDLMLKMKNL